MTNDNMDKKDGTPSEGAIISMNLSALNAGKGNGRQRGLILRKRKTKQNKTVVKMQQNNLKFLIAPLHQ